MLPSCVCMRAHSASRTPAAHLRANAFFLGEWQFSTHCQENVAIAAYHNSLHHVKFGVCKMQNFPNRGAPKTCQVPMYTIWTGGGKEERKKRRKKDRRGQMRDTECMTPGRAQKDDKTKRKTGRKTDRQKDRTTENPNSHL
jgi:hypothetical protein